MTRCPTPAHLLGLLVLAGFALALPGCGGPTAEDEADYRRLFESLGRMFDLLDTVKDAAGLRAARPQLDELESDIHELYPRVKALSEPKRKKLGEKYENLVRDAERKHVRQAQRLIRGDLPDGVLQYLAVVAEPNGTGYSQTISGAPK
jgi:hypothetical protein